MDNNQAGVTPPSPRMLARGGGSSISEGAVLLSGFYLIFQV